MNYINSNHPRVLQENYKGKDYSEERKRYGKTIRNISKAQIIQQKKINKMRKAFEQQSHLLKSPDV